LKRENIFVVEDENDILDVIEYNLSREGFRVQTSRDGEQGLRGIRESTPDLVVLDLMLPSIDGIEICRRLKSDPRTRAMPILILSAKGEESDIVLGLGVGADDYLTKPFSPRELIARIRAVLRRGPLLDDLGATERVTHAGLVVDAGRHEVTVDGELIVFTATEFRLLHYMSSHPGRVFTREQLINRVIGEDAIIIDRNVDVHVRAVRKKMGPYRDMIETIRGVGYRFRDRED
jgi:two-component system alkaline phosphatase synthesis response regulator PhoP